jgi:transposase
MLASILQIPNCTIENVQIELGTATITIHSTSEGGKCPKCQQISTSVHSYYFRHPDDLPLSDLRVQLQLRSRRFRCLNERCPQKTFCERLNEWLPVYARRTKRLSETLYEAGITAGGQAASDLLPVLRMVASRDTILRTLRREPIPELKTPRVLGVDDWAMRKGINYGTILVDVEHGCVIDLLPDRQADTVADWLKTHPGVEIVTRDRSTVYANGITEGAPEAEQVADRFHLLQNLTEATARVMKQHSGDIKAALQGEKPTKALEPAEKHSFPVKITEADKRRMEQLKEVHRLHELGHYQTEIAQQLNISRKTVNRYLQLSLEDVILQRRPRRSLITPFVPYLQKRWQEGCRNRMQLYREIQAQGYTGTASNVRKYLRSWRQTGGKDGSQKQRIPTPRTLAWLVTQPYDEQSEETKALIEQLKGAHDNVAVCIRLARQFAAMVRQRLPEKFSAWLQKAQDCGLSAFANFAKSLLTDEAAVRAALASKWSNGRTEGFINKLKLLKRQMYGRADLDLLKIRLLALTH